MTVTNLLRAETKRLRVSRITLVAVVLTLLTGAGLAAIYVGSASPYEANYWLRGDDALARVMDDGSGAALAESGAAEGVIVEDPNLPGERFYVSEDTRLRCADDDCTTVWREYPADLGDLSEELLLSTATLVSVLVVGFALLLVGSDAGNGALTTQLTFTPSRGRLLAAKTVVAAAGGALLMLIGHLIGQAILIVGFIAQRSYQEVGPLEGMLPGVARALVLAAILATAAAFVVFLAGNARGAAAITVGVVVAAWYTTPWSQKFESASQAYWYLANPLVAYSAIVNPPDVVTLITGDGVFLGVIVVTFWQGLGMAAAWLIVLGIPGYLRFTRRDIKD